jgi:poly(A) polymerase
VARNILLEAGITGHSLLQKIARILQTQNIEAYLVGGAVRDFLLGRSEIVDLDFALPGNGLTVARLVANQLRAAFYPLDEERKTGRVIVQTGVEKKFYLDFASFRADSLEADLLDRDFTINAMALNLQAPGTLIDPAGGQHDLAQAQIRAVTPRALRNDPIRVIRAIRQAVDFDFSVEAETGALVSEAGALLSLTTAERQRDEFIKLLDTSRPGFAIQTLHKLGVLLYLLPEAAAMDKVDQSPPHHLDVLQHTAAAMDAWVFMAKNEWAAIPYPSPSRIEDYFGHQLAGDLTLKQLMPLALLLHDTGKPLTRTEVIKDGKTQYQFLKHEHRSAGLTRNIARRFRFSGQATDFIANVVQNHMRPGWLSANPALSRRAVYRFFKDTTLPHINAGVAVALHALADHHATYAPGLGQPELAALRQVVNQLLVSFFEQREEVVTPVLLLTGSDLINELGLPQGKLIGMLLNQLQEAQADGQIRDRSEAIAFIKNTPDFSKFQAGQL